MPSYCVNRKAQNSGEHEVHNLNANCKYLPEHHNQLSLGFHSNCHEALLAAKAYYENVDGCFYCVSECHRK